jgi:hypothetical protein
LECSFLLYFHAWQYVAVKPQVLPFVFRDRIGVPFFGAVTKRIDLIGGKIAPSGNGDGVRSEIGDSDRLTDL